LSFVSWTGKVFSFLHEPGVNGRGEGGCRGGGGGGKGIVIGGHWPAT
jgi:hypothetical protein